ncbi:MAG: 50S ribosomal protein L18 [candidate division Zixibacteria bacterium]|nr:50S ribosomal protein L18 [candidate division Zixibacteria bacterium]
MADKNRVKDIMAERRRIRVRSKVHGTSERPRLTVCKSLNRMSLQVVDDVKQMTVIGLATDSKEMHGLIEASDSKTVASKKLGKRLAELAKAKGVEQVIFDRNQYRYHGRVKAAADGAREGGLKF